MNSVTTFCRVLSSHGSKKREKKNRRAKESGHDINIEKEQSQENISFLSYTFPIDAISRSMVVK